VNLSKAATALALCVAFAATLAAAPQATKSTPPAKSTPVEKKAPAMKPDMVKPADLPKPVTDAVMKAHPKGMIDSATKSMMGADTVYAVKVMDAGKTVTMRLKADGTSATAAKKGKGK
jgi:hypothetical protein